MAKEKNQGIRIFEEVFTPQRAEEILIEKNNLNRPLSTKRVSLYAEQIKRGMFLINGETIKFSKNPFTGKEELVDGQHRLKAVVEAGTPCRFLVAYGLPFDAFKTLDRGKKRTCGDDIYIYSKQVGRKISSDNCVKIAAAIPLVLNYEKLGYFVDSGSRDPWASLAAYHGVSTPIDTAAFFVRNEDELLEILDFYKSLIFSKKSKIVTPPVFFACAIIQFRKDRKLAKSFWREIFGSRDDDRDSRVDISDLRILALKDLCTAEFQKKVNHDLDTETRKFRLLRYVVICWNSIVNGRYYKTARGISDHLKEKLEIK